jgi:uncharacterized membrane protein YhaH (DUF805 family)
MGDIDWGHLFLQFDGRINRAKWWLGVVILWVIEGILYGILGRDNYTIFSLIGLVFLWPSLAVSIKRFHDRDKSGWWVLIALIPIIGFFWILIELGILEGTKGPNQFGSDPLGGGMAADEPAM